MKVRARTPHRFCCVIVSLWLCAGTVTRGARAQAGPEAKPDLSKSSAEELMRVYQELRTLHGSEQWAIGENVAWKRDAATFTFKDGRFSFAAPVAGRVVAAAFTGQGTFELDPPTAMDRRQIARFAKGSKLVDDFREVVLFFTDDSGDELRKLVNVRGGGDAQAASKLLESAEKYYQENFNDWWANEAKGNPPMRNLAARMLADLSDPSSRGFFLADFKGTHSGDLLYHISWNRDPILLPLFAAAAGGTTPGTAAAAGGPTAGADGQVMLIKCKRGSYYEWWSGFHTAGAYSGAAHPDHRTLLAHCRDERIDTEVSKDNHISATAEMQFEVPGATARVLPLNLEGVLRISSVTDGAGAKLSFIQEDRKLDSDLWVILPEPAATGKIYKMKIAYDEDSTRDSRVIHQEGSGLYFVGARTSWYPSFGAFDDRTHFLLHFTSPKRFKFLGTGRPVSSEKSKDSLETEWESEIPYSVVGFNYGDFVDKSKSDPNLQVTAYAGKEIPDELKNLSAVLDMEQLRRGPGAGDIDAQLGIMRGGFNTASNAAYAAAEGYQAFKLFETYFGPLPFKSISVTEQPVRGFAQSWPTLIFLPYDSLLDATTRNSLRLQDTAEQREFYNIAAVHEMSHQWWGHMVGWKTYHDQWLSEGFADFSAALYVKTFEPNKLRSFWDLKRKWLLSANTAGRRPVDVGPVWLNYQLDSYLERGNSFVLRYYKGAYILEMLRALMEDPKSSNPDGSFIAMMRDFVSTYTGKNASTEDFRRVVEKHVGQPLEWFFDEWVYGTETPRYDFSYDLKDGPQGKTILHVSLTQSEVSDSFFMKVPVYVYAGGTPRRLGFLTMKGSSTFNADIPLPIRPEKVTLDEYHSILATEKQ
jgi:peptidase M1-like protein